jgi:RHS repeat-associated protein
VARWGFGRSLVRGLSRVPRQALALMGVVAVALLVACSGLALAAGGESTDESPPSTASLSSPPPEEPGIELKSDRTATSDTFALPGGSHETHLYESPVNYRDSEGEWKPIEEGLEREGNAFVNGESGFDLRLPSRMGSAPLRFSIGDQWISERLLGSATEAGDLEGEAATYEAANPGTEFEFSTLGSGLEQRIVLGDVSEPSTLHYELSTSNGLTPTKARDGSIVFKNPDERVVAILHAPIMYDSNQAQPAISGKVGYQLARSGGSWELTLEADQEWLAQPDRVWPVVIDPAITEKLSENQDCMIVNKLYENIPGMCGQTGWQTLWTGVAPGAPGELSRILVKFGIGASGVGSPVPANAYVTDASMSLYATEVAENTNALQARQLLNTHVIGWNSGEVTWRTAYCWSGGCLPWGTPGADFNSNGAEVLTSQRGAQVGWWTFPLTSLVQGWTTGDIPNLGVVVKEDNENEGCGSGCLRRAVSFGSAAYPEPSKRPYLSVAYWPKAPATSKLASPKEGTITARRLRLSSSWESGVTGVTYQWREGKTGPFKTIPESLVRNASNQAVSWPVATEGEKLTKPIYFDAAHASEAQTKSGGTIQVRALFEGGAGAGYSEPVEAIVNRSTGGAKDATAQAGPGTLDLLTGNLAVTRTDISIPGFNSTMSFSRSLNSRGILPGPGQPGFGEEAKGLAEQNKGVLGLGWKPSIEVEAEGASEWRNLRTVSYVEELEEGITTEISYVTATNTEGAELPFEKLEAGGYAAPPEVTGWALIAEGANFVLADPAGTRTTFEPVSGTSEYVPKSVSYAGGSGNTARMAYDLVEGKKRLREMIAPTPPGVAPCTEGLGREHAGCKVLYFNYAPATTWKAPAEMGARLQSIVYFTPTLNSPEEVARYEYDSKGRLLEEWDPRISSLLKEKYTYTEGGQLATITPPGQEPWKMQYGAIEGEQANGRLMALERSSLLSSPNDVAKTTIAYGIPLSGSGAPYDLSGPAIAQWGQQDPPTDATAIFPPDQVPSSSPPSSYSHATVYYMDAEGYGVNTATPAGAGTAAGSITTSETDQFGNVVRELTAQNRLRVLAEPEGESRKKRWQEQETKRAYSADGTELQEEWGPTHQVRIAESGETRQARLYRSIEYKDPAPPAGQPAYHLPTKQFTAALAGGSLLDQRVTETAYEWSLRKPKETIVDPGAGHLAITTKTVYNETGSPIEQRQPSNPSGGGAGTTRTLYYVGSGSGECEGAPQLAGLPCKVFPAAQTSGSGRPQLAVKKIKSYNALSQPTEVLESPGGEEANIRKASMVYDAAGRPLTEKIEGAGSVVPKTETLYSSTTGLPTSRQFKCETSCTGFDTQATTTTYDALGRVTKYEDADGNKAETTYDIDSRPVTSTDNKGSQTVTYDPTSGLPTKLEDSAAGTFTASYDADGNIVERGLPDGLTAKTTYNEADEPVHLTYTKASSCGTSCTWYDEGIERSIFGQDLSQTGTLSNYQYIYDNAGRLTSAAETPTGGSCTTRSYKYDSDSNREEMATRSPGVGGVCSWSGGTTQKYKYDAADRLEGPTYDSWGRITTLPAEFAGGKTLTTRYFSTDMVAEQIQNGVTNTYQLDATGRQRQRLQAGGLEGVEVFHYDGPSDSPAWTERGSTWTRSIVGIGGELAAVQENPGTTTLQLTNLHGDIAATAELSPTATKLKATFRSDEFGNPVSGSAGRYGWLGGKQRRTELSSGVIQMGARSYIPSIGRFLSPDSVPGGSANAYDYADQDPVNGTDLDGNCPKVHVGGRWICAGASVSQVKAKTRRVERAHNFTSPTVACSGKGGCHPTGNYSGGNGLNSAVQGLASKLLNAFSTESPGSVSLNDVKNMVGAWLSTGGNKTAQIGYACGKSAYEGYKEVTPLFESGPIGAMIGSGWVLTKCASSLVP